MDSEDDMHDVHIAVESTDDDYCTIVQVDKVVLDPNDDGGGDGDHGFDNDSVDPKDDGGGDDGDLVFYNEYSVDSNYGSRRSQQKNYIVLNEEEIRQHQENETNTVSTVLSVSRLDASILLRHYHWSASNVHEAWFADEERVRNAVGLFERPVVRDPDSKELICGICFEIYPLDHQVSSAASCGHRFCNQCWSAYMSTSINGGLGCLTLRCPEPSCGAAVGQDMIDLLASEEDKEKYARYLFRSYVEDNRKTKWCPAPGCDYAVEFVVGSENYDVFCLCSNGFCWNCKEEAHRPMDCGNVAKWMTKNSSESENTNWILANSKPCPKCRKPIEKNHGCMHMTCRPPCSFQFCWLCLGAWSNHGAKTGGFYSCNRYEAARQEDKEFDETERRRKMAKRSMQRYSHYYERWASNHSSRQKALADLRQVPTLEKKLSDEYSMPESRLKFITEAWAQIVECRRVLKWTYAYGYYLPAEPEEHHAKRLLFEYLQGEAEAGLERLHRCAEEDVQAYLAPPPDHHPPETDFNGFCNRLAGLTKVTGKYFENLVRALENGLSDVEYSRGESSNPDQIIPHQMFAKMREVPRAPPPAA